MNNRLKDIVRFYVVSDGEIDVAQDDKWETDDLEELKTAIVDILLYRAIHGEPE